MWKAIKAGKREGDGFKILARCNFCNRETTVMAYKEMKNFLIPINYNDTPIEKTPIIILIRICKTCANEAIEAIDCRYGLDFKSGFRESRINEKFRKVDDHYCPEPAKLRDMTETCGGYEGYRSGYGGDCSGDNCMEDCYIPIDMCKEQVLGE